MRILLTFAIAAMLAIPGAPVSAHLAGGADVLIDGNLVDFGWDPEPLVAGKPATFGLNLVDPKTSLMLDFDSAWIRVTKGDDTLLAGTFRPQANNITFTMVFPYPGEHEVAVRIKGPEGMTMAETSFPVKVAEGPAAPPSRDRRSDIALAITAAVAMAIGLALGRRHRHTH